MKKIIILSDTGEPRYGLVSHLKELFPECEIQILLRRSKNVEERVITATTVFKENKFGETVT
ncbi:MAG: hypothetical protein PVJ50_05350 [Desulfobacterales bacterium]|jgi:hypothetical protein